MCLQLPRLPGRAPTRLWTFAQHHLPRLCSLMPPGACAPHPKTAVIAAELNNCIPAAALACMLPASPLQRPGMWRWPFRFVLPGSWTASVGRGELGMATRFSLGNMLSDGCHRLELSSGEVLLLELMIELHIQPLEIWLSVMGSDCAGDPELSSALSRPKWLW